MMSLHEHLSELVKTVLLCMLCSEFNIGKSCKFIYAKTKAQINS